MGRGVLYVYVYVYMHIYIYMHICVDMCACIYIYMPISTLISRLYMNAHKSEGIPMSLPEGTRSWVCC